MDLLSARVQSMALDKEGRPSPAPTPAQTSVLTSLPPELLFNIIYAVDPISLIALAQTCHYLRTFIKPSRHHLLQRLLRIELETEDRLRDLRGDSGKLPDQSHSGRVDVGRTPYGCSECLRLRPHIMFDNHSIFKLKWLRPPAGSYEATKLTDWINPNDCDERGMKIQVHRQRQAEKKEIKEWKEAYVHAMEGEDEGMRKVAELQLAGRSRNTRLCNDCKLEQGYYSRSNFANRSQIPDLPIILSRQLPYRTSIDRYFPRLFPLLDPSECPRLFKIMREGREELYSLYTAKCPTCHRWKEAANFHQIKDKMPTTRNFDKLMCNSCLAKDSPSILVRVSRDIALTLAKENLRTARYAFHFGWRLLEYRLRTEANKKSYWDHLGRLKTQLLAKLPWRITKNYGGDQRELLVDQCDRDDLRNRVRLFRGFCNWLSKADREDVLSNEWFRYWVEDYEKLEKAWEMATARLDRIQDEDFGQQLLKWAVRT